MLGILQTLLHKPYKLPHLQFKKKKKKSTFHLLCCLDGANHILATSICKIFVVKLVVILAFSLTIYQTQNKFKKKKYKVRYFYCKAKKKKKLFCV